jgi:hypothetical protein
VIDPLRKLSPPETGAPPVQRPHTTHASCLGTRLRDASQAATGVKDLELPLRRSKERPNFEIEPALYVVGVAFVVVVAGVHPTTTIVATPNFVSHVAAIR